MHFIVGGGVVGLEGFVILSWESWAYQFPPGGLQKEAKLCPKRDLLIRQELGNIFFNSAHLAQTDKSALGPESNSRNVSSPFALFSVHFTRYIHKPLKEFILFFILRTTQCLCTCLKPLVRGHAFLTIKVPIVSLKDLYVTQGSSQNQKLLFDIFAQRNSFRNLYF